MIWPLTERVGEGVGRLPSPVLACSDAWWTEAGPRIRKRKTAPAIDKPISSGLKSKTFEFLNLWIVAPAEDDTHCPCMHTWLTAGAIASAVLSLAPVASLFFV